MAPSDPPVAGAAAEADAARTPQRLRIDEWWGRVLSNPRRFRAWYWGGPLGVTLLAGILRFWNLRHPGTLVFDEIYYVRDAWSQLVLGYSGSWPDGVPATMDADVLAQMSDSASYVVHPPIGKWLIGLGMLLFGPEDPAGWRFATALLGTLSVLLVVLVARRLLGSTLLAVTAGLAMAVDGIGIVLSRVALLDGVLAFFVLLGAWLVLVDRDRQRVRWALWEAGRAVGRVRESDWGPILWRRPWVLAAGVAFGLACGVKWNGLYFLAGFGVYLVISDLVTRRRYGLRAWFSDGILRQGPVSFLLLVPVAAVTYLASWAGWILTRGGWDRDWATRPGNALEGFWSWIPSWAQSLWHYHEQMWDWHSDLRQPHPYQANPLGWPILLRPTSMFYESFDPGTAECAGPWSCSQAITGLSNPIVWWVGLVAGLFLAYLLIRRRDAASGFVLTGLAAGYLPWVAAAFDRSAVFQFYTVSYLPFLALAIAVAAGRLLGSRDDPPERRLTGIRVYGILVAAALVVAAFFFPLWTGATVPFWFWQIHMWLPSWV